MKANNISLDDALNKSQLKKETKMYRKEISAYLHIHVCMMYLRQKDSVVMALMKTPAVKLYSAMDDPFYRCIEPHGFHHTLGNLMSAQELKEYEMKRGKKIMFTKLVGHQRTFAIDNYYNMYSMSLLWQRSALFELIQRNYDEN